MFSFLSLFIIDRHVACCNLTENNHEGSNNNGKGLGCHLMLSFVAIGAVSEVIFGSGIFGVNVIGNLTSIINKFGQSGFAGLVALLVLVGLFKGK